MSTRDFGSPSVAFLSAVLLMANCLPSDDNFNDVSSHVIKTLESYVQLGGSLDLVGARSPLGPFHIILIASAYGYHDVVEWLVSTQSIDVSYSYYGQTLFNCAAGCFYQAFIDQFNHHFYSLFHSTPSTAQDSAHVRDAQQARAIVTDMLASQMGDATTVGLYLLPIPFGSHNVKLFNLIRPLGGDMHRQPLPQWHQVDIINSTKHAPLDENLFLIFQSIVTFSALKNVHNPLTAFLSRPTHRQESLSELYSQFCELFVSIQPESESAGNDQDEDDEDDTGLAAISTPQDTTGDHRKHYAQKMTHSSYLTMELAAPDVNAQFIHQQLLALIRNNRFWSPKKLASVVLSLLVSFYTSAFPLQTAAQLNTALVLLQFYFKCADAVPKTDQFPRLCLARLFTSLHGQKPEQSVYFGRNHTIPTHHGKVTPAPISAVKLDLTASPESQPSYAPSNPNLLSVDSRVDGFYYPVTESILNDTVLDKVEPKVSTHRTSQFTGRMFDYLVDKATPDEETAAAASLKTIPLILSQLGLSLSTKLHLVKAFHRYLCKLGSYSRDMLAHGSMPLLYAHNIYGMGRQYDSSCDNFDDFSALIHVLLHDIFEYHPNMMGSTLHRIFAALVASGCRNENMSCQDFNSLLQIVTAAYSSNRNAYTQLLVYILDTLGRQSYRYSSIALRRGEQIHWLLAYHDNPQAIPSEVLSNGIFFFPNNEKAAQSKDLAAGQDGYVSLDDSSYQHVPILSRDDIESSVLHTLISSALSSSVLDDKEIGKATYALACMTSALTLYLFSSPLTPAYPQQHFEDHVFPVLHQVSVDGKEDGDDDDGDDDGMKTKETPPNRQFILIFFKFVESFTSDRIRLPPRALYSTFFDRTFHHLVDTVEECVTSSSTDISSMLTESRINFLIIALGASFSPLHLKAGEHLSFEKTANLPVCFQSIMNTCKRVFELSQRKSISITMLIFSTVADRYFTTDNHTHIIEFFVYIYQMLRSLNIKLEYTHYGERFPAPCLPHAFFMFKFHFAHSYLSNLSKSFNIKISHSFLNKTIALLHLCHTCPQSVIDMDPDGSIKDTWETGTRLFVDLLAKYAHLAIGFFVVPLVNLNWFCLLSHFLNTGIIPLYTRFANDYSIGRYTEGRDDISKTVDTLGAVTTNLLESITTHPHSAVCYFFSLLMVIVSNAHQKRAQVPAVFELTTPNAQSTSSFNFEYALNFATKHLSEHAPEYSHAWEMACHVAFTLGQQQHEADGTRADALPSSSPSCLAADLSTLQDSVSTARDQIRSILQVVPSTLAYTVPLSRATLFSTLSHKDNRIHDVPFVTSQSIVNVVQTLLRSATKGYDRFNPPISALLEDSPFYSPAKVSLTYKLLGMGHTPHMPFPPQTSGGSKADRNNTNDLTLGHCAPLLKDLLKITREESTAGQYPTLQSFFKDRNQYNDQDPDLILPDIMSLFHNITGQNMPFNPSLVNVFVAIVFYQLKHKFVPIELPSTTTGSDVPQPTTSNHTPKQVLTTTGSSSMLSKVPSVPVNYHHPTVLSALANHPNRLVTRELFGTQHPTQAELSLATTQNLTHFTATRSVNWSALATHASNLYPVYKSIDKGPTLSTCLYQQSDENVIWHPAENEGILWYILHHVACPSIDDIMFLLMLESSTSSNDQQQQSGAVPAEAGDNVDVDMGDINLNHDGATPLLDLNSLNQHNESILMHAILRRWPEAALLFLINAVGLDHSRTHMDGDGYTARDYVYFCNTKAYAPAVVELLESTD